MRLKILLISFVLSLPFWWGANILEKNLSQALFWQKLASDPHIFAAQINFEENLIRESPVAIRGIEEPDISIKSGLSIFLDDNGKEMVLFEKLANENLPIASLTKLMTALIVLENYDLSKEVTVSKEAINQEGNFGQLKPEGVFTVKDLLYALLMESSNDAAYALAADYDGTTERNFVILMNQKAKELKLENSFFDNTTGLDPEESGTKPNYSTAKDLVKITRELLNHPLAWEILTTLTYNSYGSELVNTNELLGEMPGIVGGKTGYTEEAGGCMLLVVKAPKNKGYLINVVLGTEDRFLTMKELVSWTKTAYRW